MHKVALFLISTGQCNSSQVSNSCWTALIFTCCNNILEVGVILIKNRKLNYSTALMCNIYNYNLL